MPADDNADRALRVQRLTSLLLRRIRTEAEKDELSIAQDWAIALLLEQPRSSAELARAQGVRAQSMSAVVAALEAAGHVRREADPADGRRVVLHPTRSATAAHEAAIARKQGWMRAAIDQLGPDELRELDAGLALLERVAGSDRAS